MSEERTYDLVVIKSYGPDGDEECLRDYFTREMADAVRRAWTLHGNMGILTQGPGAAAAHLAVQKCLRDVHQRIVALLPDEPQTAP